MAGDAGLVNRKEAEKVIYTGQHNGRRAEDGLHASEMQFRSDEMDDSLVQGGRRMEAGADRTVRAAPASTRAGNAFHVGLQPGANDYNSVHVRRQIEQRMGQLDLERSGTTADQ